MMDREEMLRLLTAYADGELSEQERIRVESLLEDDPEMRGELESIRKLSELTAKIQLAEPEQEVWKMYWANVYNRLERGLGWIFFSIGAIILLAWGAWLYLNDFLLNSEISLFMRTGVSLVALGTIVLFVSVLRERLFIRKKERYKEIMQ